MSKKRAIATAVIEWSPTHVSWVGPNHQLNTAASLSEAASMLPGKDLLVSISRRSAFVRVYRVPNASKPEVRRILDLQIGQLFPIAASELAFDFHLTQDVNMEGRLAVIAAMRASDLQLMQEQARAAGLRVVQVMPAALGSALLAKSMSREDAAVVQRTAEGLSIDLVAAGELRYSRIAQMPGSALGIDAEVSRTFAAAVVPPTPIIAAGGLGIQEAAVTDSWSLEPLATSDIDINIESTEWIVSREKRQQAARLRVSVAFFVIAAACFVFQYLRYNTAASAYQKAADSQLAMRNAEEKKKKDEMTKNSTVVSLRDTLNRAFHPAQSMADVLTITSNSTPAGVWLTNISLERGKVMTLKGTATKGEAVVDYQQQLIGEERLRDVQLVSATNSLIENTPVVQFLISAFPVGNLPLLEATKKVAQK